jgi:hypothetical protein
MKKYILPLSVLPLSAIAGMAIVFMIGKGNAAVNTGISAIAVENEVHIAKVQAEGAQVYECKANASGALVWQFREPVATLLENGTIVGYHYAGPRWELADGSFIVAKVVARADGASAADIPLLKLEVTERNIVGRLAEVTTIQRINTKGGVAHGSCPAAGKLLSAPYTAEYVFTRKLEDLLPATH